MVSVIYCSTSVHQLRAVLSHAEDSKVAVSVAWFSVSGRLLLRHTQSLVHIITDLLTCIFKEAKHCTAVRATV